MGTGPAIEVNDVSKEYTVVQGTLWKRRQSVVRALRGISFEIAHGDIVGYIGRNGAGKTTTIKILSGILARTGGDVRVLGLDPFRQRSKHVWNIGVVMGQRSLLWYDVPALDSLALYASMYGMSRVDLDLRIAGLDEVLNFRRFLRIPVRKLSLGERMKLEFVAAMLHRPKVLFMDEPTIGLDVVAKAAIRDYVSKLNQAEGVTVLLTTHDMDEIEQLASTILILDEGLIVYRGSLASLKADLDMKRVFVYGADVELDSFGDCISRGVRSPGQLTFTVEGRFLPRITQLLTSLCQEKGCSYQVRDLSLEDIVLWRYTNKREDS